MVKVVYEGQPYKLKKGETLLDGLLEHGVQVPHGCRTGSCQSCLLKCLVGDIPKASQRGLRESQKINRLFLACQCLPETAIEVSLPESEGATLLARIEGLRNLNFETMELVLKPERPLDYRAGQFLRLYNPEGTSRSYSLASVPAIDLALALHIRLHPEGLLSPWVHYRLRIGDMVSISEPLGECFYVPGKSDQPLLLIGTGSGLAPLYGILRDALEKGHTGPIHLYHGARTPEGLYLTRDLEHLAAHYPNFGFAPCVSEIGKALPTGILKGRVSEIALAAHSDLKGWRVFLCGNPDMVRSTQIQAFLAGASLEEIHADPFDSQATTFTAT